MTSNFHSGFLKDISSMLIDSDEYNVIIQIKENQNIKEFRAHSNILRVRSPYFKNLISADKIKNMWLYLINLISLQLFSKLFSSK